MTYPMPSMPQAACTADPFFTTIGFEKDSAAICNTFCPEQTKCLDYALHVDVSGVWGGTSHNQRRRLRPRGFVPEKVAIVEDYLPSLDRARRDVPLTDWERDDIAAQYVPLAPSLHNPGLHELAARYGVSASYVKRLHRERRGAVSRAS